MNARVRDRDVVNGVSKLLIDRVNGFERSGLPIGEPLFRRDRFRRDRFQS